MSAATLLLFAGAAVAEPTTPAAGGGRIGVAMIGPAALPTDLRIRLEDAAANGLKAAGAQVVTAGELSRARAGAALGSCSDALCERRLAQVTDIRYWLRGTCQLDTSTYRLHLELVDARSGAVVVARDDTCDICTEADAAETANMSASALKAALGRTGGGAPAASPAVATTDGRQLGAGDSGTPGEKPAASPTGGEGAADARAPWWRRSLPWAAFGAAAAAGVGGIYYLAVDEDASQCKGGQMGTCRELNDTLWRQAVPLLALSAALATTGVLLLTMDRSPGPDSASVTTGRRRPPPPTQVAIGPGGVFVSGSF